MSVEYRLITKREGLAPRVKIYRTLKGAQRRLLLYGPEPWLYRGKGPDDLCCCDGWECGCRGETERERADKIRADCPALQYARIEQRNVTTWRPL